MIAPGIILTIYLILFCLEYLWETFLDVLNMDYVDKNRKRIPAYILGIVDRQTYNQSIRYTLAKNRLALIASGFTALLLLILILSGFLGDLDRWLLNFKLSPSIHGILYIYAISILMQVCSLPFTLYSRFFLEEKFGFNNMTFGVFVLDLLKGMLLAVIIITPLLTLLFFLMDQAGGLWWVYAFLAYAAFQFLMTFLFPKVIAPLFNKFTPLPDGPLREKIFELSRALNFRTNAIFIMDGSRRSGHSNAYFTGLGKVKRIVLFDTLIRLLNEGEILGVLAHEVGHEKKHHNKIGLVLSLASAFAGFAILSLLMDFPPLFEAFGFMKPSTHTALVLLLYFSGPVTSFLSPFTSFISRKMEFAADRYAVRFTGKDGLKKALLSLSRDNLANFTPHPWYSFYHYSHPTLSERVTAIDKAQTP